MTFIITSPEDIINLTLSRIGYKGRIGSIWDGLFASKKFLDIYSQTRDELLRLGDWGFAERNVNMNLLKSAPAYGYIPPVTWNNTYPPPPWFFEYEYPSDCLKVRSIKFSPIFIINYDPQYNNFAIENDQAYSPPKKVILSNVPNAILVYTAQVTDPTSWEADFIEAFSSALGRRIAPVLMGLESAKMEVADETASKTQAENERG